MAHPSSITVYSVAEALRIGRTIPCQPDQREQVARYFALIDAPLGGMRETARIIGELRREERRVARDVDLVHAVAAMGVAA